MFVCLRKKEEAEGREGKGREKEGKGMMRVDGEGK